MRKIGSLIAFVVAAVLAWMPASRAADYPTRPIKFVVPYVAGGPTDAQARLFGEYLGREFKQSVFVENKGSAQGAIGAEAVAHLDGLLDQATALQEAALAITADGRPIRPSDFVQRYTGALARIQFAIKTVTITCGRKILIGFPDVKHGRIRSRRNHRSRSNGMIILAEHPIFRSNRWVPQQLNQAPLKVSHRNLFNPKLGRTRRWQTG